MPKHEAADFLPCLMETTRALISNRWRVVIIRELLGGTKRFGELQRSVRSISQKVLTANLREMEQMGLVRREVFAEVPPRVEHSLTDLGRSLQPVIDALRIWGEEFKEKMAGGEQGRMLAPHGVAGGRARRHLCLP